METEVGGIDLPVKFIDVECTDCDILPGHYQGSPVRVCWR